MLRIIEFAFCLLFLVWAGMLPVALLWSWNGYRQNLVEKLVSVMLDCQNTPSDSPWRRWTLLYNYPVSAVVVLCSASWYIGWLYPMLHVVSSTDRVMGQVHASLRVRELGTFSQTLGCSLVLCRVVFIIFCSFRKCLYTCKIFTALNIKLNGFYKQIFFYCILFYSLHINT